ncbi:carbohydrate-binding domain-containing protein [Paenibacillus sp.]|uniref:carbohydrate-binding domain-containing protein n=1 Tax=Paenibacillus sp. TaxID=58172 RepID=UPI002811F282|nr:carbohydrate-binding domain-containing protein [Paenibacillus sp.]
MKTEHKRFKLWALLFCFAAALSACGGAEDPASTETVAAVAETTAAQTDGSAETSAAVAADSPVPATYEDEDLAADWSAENPTAIDLNAEAGPVKITAAGTFVLSGKLSDGGVVVEVSNEEKVRIVLNGADIRNASGPAIEIVEAEKVFLTLQEGSNNVVSDGSTYADTAEDAPNAAVYSKADLVVNGSGSLVVQGNYKDGLTSRDDLKIVSGSIEVHATDDGVVGRDLLAVKDGSLTVEAGGDGLKSTNDTEEGRGNIAIEGGAFVIDAGGDGLQAAVSVRVDGGSFDIVSGGGSANGEVHTDDQAWGIGMGARQPSESTAPSATATATTATATTTAADATDAASMKGVKAASHIVATAGTIAIDSADDAIHSNGSIAIGGGEWNVSSGDDGLHADASIVVEGGNLVIAKSYEGIESAVVTIAGGDVRVAADDDGVNVAGGNDGSSAGGRPGEDAFAGSGDYKLVITGGTLIVDAEGDGLDSNGSIEMSGGTVVVYGPTSAGNGALDYNGSFELSGGSLVAAGSAGMASAPSDGSTQASILMTFPQTQAAGTTVRVEDASGKEVAAVAPTKAFQTIAISSSGLQQGGAYTLYTGDTEIVSFEIAQSVTWLNESGVTEAQSGGPGGFGGGRRPAGGERPASPQP